eukprot:jgi/Bigna1/73584/fgenesh1_pg.25_\
MKGGDRGDPGENSAEPGKRSSIEPATDEKAMKKGVGGGEGKTSEVTLEPALSTLLAKNALLRKYGSILAKLKTSSLGLELINKDTLLSLCKQAGMHKRGHQMRMRRVWEACKTTTSITGQIHARAARLSASKLTVDDVEIMEIHVFRWEEKTKAVDLLASDAARELPQSDLESISAALARMKTCNNKQKSRCETNALRDEQDGIYNTNYFPQGIKFRTEKYMYSKWFSDEHMNILALGKLPSVRDTESCWPELMLGCTSELNLGLVVQYRHRGTMIDEWSHGPHSRNHHKLGEQVFGTLRAMAWSEKMQTSAAATAT